MADSGHDAPRFPAQAGRKAAVGGAALAWSLLLAVSTIALTLTRPFLTMALAIGTTAGLVIATVFALDGRWSDALVAAAVGLLTGAVFAAYASLTTWLDPKFFRPSKRRRREW
jgi:CHASE2 domain-containing sensor protein